MLNLSDKELDRLSREAANQHEPGDLTGPRSWERLEFRLDKELGRIGPNPLRGLRGFRRIPFYYAPAILLLVGVGLTYYFVKQNKNNIAKTEPSGSPPMTVVKPMTPEQNNSIDLSTKTSENSHNSTPASTDTLESTVTPGSTDTQGSTVPGEKSIIPGSTATSTASGRPTDLPGSTVSGRSTVPSESTASGQSTVLPGSAGPKRRSPVTQSSTAPGDRSASAPPGSIASGQSTALPGSTIPEKGASTPPGSTEGATVNSRKNNRGRKDHAKPKNTDLPANQLPDSQDPAYTANHNHDPVRHAGGNPDNHSNNSNHNPGQDPSKETTTIREPALSLIQGPRSLARSRGIDDSALRAFTLKGASASTPIRIDKKKNASLNVNRPLQFGFSISPDFASVNSLAGDRPGSSIGITMDYQFLDRLYLSTGLLLTRKNFAASPDNYHAPPGSYRIIGFPVTDVNLIKGSFYMLEIPLSLRYDFHLSGNTTFFISGGASSYLLTSEHSQYYFNYFGMQACRPFDKEQESRRRNYLFSAVDFSMGVETGLSNSLSLLIAPYAKIPTRGMGVGQVQITSVGINFALKYAPVLSRKRH